MSQVEIFIRDANGVAQPVSATNPIPVGEYTPAGAAASYTEDAAAPANASGNPVMLVREDARAGSLTTTDGDMLAQRGNNKGEAYVKDMTLLDNAISMTIFAGGASSLTELRSIYVPLNMKSVSGAWKITTGADVSVIGIGNFT